MMMSLMSVLPVVRIASWLTTVMGLVDTRFGEAMRDPVTTTSSTAGVAAAAAGAASCAYAGSANAAIVATGASRLMACATKCAALILILFPSLERNSFR